MDLQTQTQILDELYQNECLVAFEIEPGSNQYANAACLNGEIHIFNEICTGEKVTIEDINGDIDLVDRLWLATVTFNQGEITSYLFRSATTADKDASSHVFDILAPYIEPANVLLDF